MTKRLANNGAAQRGLSLVEILVGLAVGLLVVVAVLLLIVRMSGSRGDIDRASRQIENGRFAVHKLAEDLRHAGFVGEFSDLVVPTAGMLALDPCTTAAAELRQLAHVPIRPYTAATAASKPSCIPAADFVAGSHVLVLRFASPIVTAPAALDGALMYVQSTTGDTIVARGNVSPPLSTFTLERQTTLPGAAEPGPIRKVVVRMYFLSPCSRPAPGQASCTAAADDGTPIRTLKMIELDAVGGAPAFTAPRAIAEGIERVEFDYGIDDDGDGAADRLSTCAAATPCSGADLANVVAVNVHVLARETEPSAGFTDAKTYALGLAGAFTPSGADARFRRHLFSATVRLNNISMRRE